MTTTGRILGMILFLAVPAAFAEKAEQRDGGSGSSSSSGSSGTASGGSSHSGSGTASGGSSGGSSSGSSSDSGSSGRAVPRDSGGSSDRGSGSVGRHGGTSGRGDGGYSGRAGESYGGSSGGHAQSDAERRSPRPRNTRGDDDHYSGYSRGGRVLYGHYGAHYHGTIYYPYSCYDYHYSYWDYPYRNRSYGYDPTGAVRVLVDPKETKVYVDGYYAGIADDFDGIFQRLYLPPGRHEVALKLDGYKTHRVQIYSARGHTIKLHHDMVQGEGEDEPENMVGPMDEDMDEDEARLRENEDPPARGEARIRKGGLGTLRLSVSPKDAAVYVDGEFWGNGISEDLKLPAGRHEIAVVRPGFQSYERQIEIRADDTLELDIDLRKS